MTELLQRAFLKASQLLPDEQDAFAAWILYAFESEERWNELFARSPDLLANMAEEAIAEDDAGQTEPLDPDDI